MKIPALIVLLSFYMAPTSNADSNLLTDDLREYAQKMEKDARPRQESIDEFIRILDLVQPEKPINVEVVNKRIDKMGIVDALIIPSLLEMDYLLAEGNFQQAEILNIAISKLDRNMSNQLGKTFGLNNDEVQFDLSSINTQNDTFNFERSFGDQYTNFGDRAGFGGDRGGFGDDRGGFGDDRGGFGDDRGGFGGDRGGFGGDRGGFGGDRAVFGGDRGGFGGDRGGFGGDRGGFGGDRGGFGGDRGGFGGDRGGFGGDRGGFGGDRGGFGGDRGGFGGDRGGFGGDRVEPTSFSNRPSPIFGDPSIRSTASYRSRGGECVAGCNSGIGPGASIGTAAGGLIGTILTGPAGTLPGASGGALAGGAIGCIVGCISGPPETTTPSTTTPSTTTPETTPPATTNPETTPPATTNPETTPPETTTPETTPPETTTPDNNPRPKKPEDQVRTVNPDSELGGVIFTNPGRRVNGTNTNLIRILNNNDAPLTNYGQPIL